MDCSRVAVLAIALRRRSVPFSVSKAVCDPAPPVVGHRQRRATVTILSKREAGRPGIFAWTVGFDALWRRPILLYYRRRRLRGFLRVFFNIRFSQAVYVATFDQVPGWHNNRSAAL
jgi:hypothetical protein